MEIFSIMTLCWVLIILSIILFIVYLTDTDKHGNRNNTYLILTLVLFFLSLFIFWNVEA
jgi:hypothetical protein